MGYHSIPVMTNDIYCMKCLSGQLDKLDKLDKAWDWFYSLLVMDNIAERATRALALSREHHPLALSLVTSWPDLDHESLKHSKMH